MERKRKVSILNCFSKGRSDKITVRMRREDRAGLCAVFPSGTQLPEGRKRVMLYPIENRVREVKNLSGIWRFKIDKENCGIARKWYEAPLKDTVFMAVPAS